MLNAAFERAKATGWPAPLMSPRGTIPLPPKQWVRR